MYTELPPGSTTNIMDYMYPLGFQSSAKKIVIETGDEILFIQYYSGGAHCCFVYEAFKYDTIIGAYQYLDMFSCEECTAELFYPFEYYEWMDYFYCSYPEGIEITCPKANYSSYTHLTNGRFVAKIKGNKKALKQCFIHYCQNTRFPELGEGDDGDDGEREAALNLLYKIYTLNKDIEAVSNLFYLDCPPVPDKDALWNEIKKFILVK